jgi:hypothetical protein
MCSRPDSCHARPACTARYTGTLAPSHTRIAAAASRLSGGVVITTYAAATPAVARRKFATVLAVGLVIYELREPLEPELDPPDDGVPRPPLPRVESDGLPRKLSDPL